MRERDIASAKHWATQGMAVMVWQAFADIGKLESEEPLLRQLLAEALRNFAIRKDREEKFDLADEARKRALMIDNGLTLDYVVHPSFPLPT